MYRTKSLWLALLASTYLAQPMVEAEARNCAKITDRMPDAQTIIDKQLAMNRQTWASLLKHGVTEHTPLRLDFFYISPTQSVAQCLVDLMRAETDYDVEKPSPSDGTWKVSGSTQPTRVAPDVLDEWVKWMVVAGIRSGGSVFDGWGTEIPPK